MGRKSEMCWGRGVPKKPECQAEDFGFYLEQRGDIVRLAFQKDQSRKWFEMGREQGRSRHTGQ